MTFSESNLTPSTPSGVSVRRHLPIELVVFAVVVILTDAAFAILDQPAEFWLDYNRAVLGLEPLRQVLTISPWLLLSLGVVYALIIGAALRFLPRSLGLVIWTIVCVLHLGSIKVNALCGLGQFYAIGNDAVCKGASYAVHIVLSALMGLVLALALSRLLHENTPVPRKPLYAQLALGGAGLAVVWLVALSVGIAWSTQLPETGWRPISPAHRPPGRTESAVAYDVSRNQHVLFGGITAWTGNDPLYDNETWIWDGVDWTKRDTAIAPPPRTAHAMAYDEAQSVIVLFGGKNQNGDMQDTWEWDGQQWRQAIPSVVPPARCCHKLFYDVLRRRVVLYGGTLSGQIFYNDAWEWTGEDWQSITFSSTSPVASGYDLAYDTKDQHLVALLSGFPNGTWIWKGDSWSKPTLETEPPERTGVLTNDPVRQQIVLFGGIRQQKLFNDTWLFTDGMWQEYRSPIQPEPRWGHNLFFDRSRQRVVMFGGFDGESYLNDMWELRLSSDQ